MARIAADSADDAGRVVGLVRAVVLAVANATAVLAGLVLVVTEGTVQSGELAKLVPLERVLALGNGGGLEKSATVLDRGGMVLLTVSMTLWISFLALLIFSSVSAIIRQCRSSSWLLECAASDRPLPSFTEPLPLIAIFARESCSIFFRVLPRGPMSKPTLQGES